MIVIGYLNSWRIPSLFSEYQGSFLMVHWFPILQAAPARQTVLERQQHAEKVQLKDQMEKLKRSEDETW
jgi:hypothetical protein